MAGLYLFCNCWLDVVLFGMFPHLGTERAKLMCRAFKLCCNIRMKVNTNYTFPHDFSSKCAESSC